MFFVRADHPLLPKWQKWKVILQAKTMSFFFEQKYWSHWLWRKEVHEGESQSKQAARCFLDAPKSYLLFPHTSLFHKARRFVHLRVYLSRWLCVILWQWTVQTEEEGDRRGDICLFQQDLSKNNYYILIYKFSVMSTEANVYLKSSFQSDLSSLNFFVSSVLWHNSAWVQI